MNILFVTSSSRGSASYSNRVATNVLTELRSRNPGARATVRDLGREPLPHINDDFVTATRGATMPQTDEQRALLAHSEALVDELLAADVIVIAAPMINFSIPSNLKAWIDYVARAGRTFRYSEKGPEGLVTGKQVIIVAARGGVYAAQSGVGLPGAVSQERARLPRHDRCGSARGRGHGLRAGRCRERRHGRHREAACDL